MSRNAKIGIVVAVLLVVGWAIGDDPAPEAPAAPAPVEAQAPVPAPAPEPEPEPEVEELTEEEVLDLFGTDMIMDMVWADMDSEARAELCVGVGLFGAEGAATIIVAEAPTFDVKEVAAWLAKTCA
jgi:hypothetical protein